jgi:hypothetical protein
MEGWKPCANRRPVYTLKNIQWCGELCFAGAAIVRGRCLPQFPGGESISHYWFNQCFMSKSKSKLLYDWRFTINQFILASSSLRLTARNFFQLNPCSHSLYVTSSLTIRWVCLWWIWLSFRQVYISHIYHVIENSSFCTIYKPPVSTGFVKQIMPTLHILCYNGSLVPWSAVSLTTDISYVWLHLVPYSKHVHSHDFVWFLLIACTILLYNHINMKG